MNDKRVQDFFTGYCLTLRCLLIIIFRFKLRYQKSFIITGVEPDTKCTQYIRMMYLHVCTLSFTLETRDFNLMFVVFPVSNQSQQKHTHTRVCIK